MTRKTYSLFALVFAGFFFVSCDKESNEPFDESNCGDDAKNVLQHYISSPPWKSKDWNTYIEGQNRVFQVSSDMVDSVCPDREIIIFDTSSCKKPQVRNIQVRLKYRYGLFGVYGNTFVPGKQIEPDLIHFDGRFVFGIKDAYGNDPGSFYYMVEWVIDGVNSDTTDLEYFKSVFYEVFIVAEYKKVKK